MWWKEFFYRWSNDVNGTIYGHVQVFGNIGESWTNIGGDIYWDSANDNMYYVEISDNVNNVPVRENFNNENVSDSGNVSVYTVSVT